MNRLIGIALGLLLALAGGVDAQVHTSANSLGGRGLAQRIPASFVLAKTAIPFVSVSTGTMGNNGAMTVGTALPSAYPNAFFFLPAGAVAAGVPSAASWFFGQCTTTTACIVCNNTYTTGVPALPICTAFATTGPGAFTGDTTEEVAIQITVPAGSMGANGTIRSHTRMAVNSNANVKTFRLRFSGASGSICMAHAPTSALWGSFLSEIANRGVTGAQLCDPVGNGPYGGLAALGNAGVYPAVDTTAATTLVWTIQKSTATDNAVIESIFSELVSDGT